MESADIHIPIEGRTLRHPYKRTFLANSGPEKQWRPGKRALEAERCARLLERACWRNWRAIMPDLKYVGATIREGAPVFEVDVGPLWPYGIKTRAVVNQLKNFSILRYPAVNRPDAEYETVLAPEVTDALLSIYR